ncbi:MAG TPA: XamI family restriction endonuclease [Sedimentisphaerales bacterium]|nr:XamI family restriction endonuclease [Sedimentisphaerales bacterium]
MGVNCDKPERWKRDIALSVDLYNEWFLSFAPTTYRQERVKATEKVEAMLSRTAYLRKLTIRELSEHPSILFGLRMCTAPPIARDRLVGLARVPRSLVDAMERDDCLPVQMKPADREEAVQRIITMITRLIDVDIFTWLAENRSPRQEETYRSATIVADRLCGANANPIVRNAQERRQLDRIKAWLETRRFEDVTGRIVLKDMQPGTFAFRLNVPGLKEDRKTINIPVDAVVMPMKAKAGQLPVLIEAKSAGDFANTNKRRKEEAAKIGQLRKMHGDAVRYVLFLCGYFDSGYLGYEAAEGIDWVWEHRMDDLKGFGL